MFPQRGARMLPVASSAPPHFTPPPVPGGHWRFQQQQQPHQGFYGGRGHHHQFHQQQQIDPNQYNNGNEGGGGWGGGRGGRGGNGNFPGSYHNNGQGEGGAGQERSRVRGGWRGRARGGGDGDGGGRGRGNFRGRGRGRGRGGNNGFQGTNNNKSTFYCCSCERSFRTQEQLVEHNKEHIVCGLDGCQFEAHSLVVTKHIRMQHEGNLFQRMKNLNTPDDIKRWREERKKNFPTQDKLQQKAEEQKEKAERREICRSGGGPGPGGPNRTTAPDMPIGVFRYKMQHQDMNREMSYSEYKYRMRKLHYELNDNWATRSFAPDPKKPHIRVPFGTLNKSRLLSLENFYLSAKLGADGKLKKERKVKWKGFKARTLDRLEDSESEKEDNALPISDEEDDFYNAPPQKDPGTSNNEEPAAAATPRNEPPAVAKPTSLGLMLVDYSSASDSDNEADSCEVDAKSATASVVGVPSKSANDEEVQSCVVGTSTGDVDSSTGSDSDSMSDDDEDSYDSDSSMSSISSTEPMTIDEFEEHAVFNKGKPIYAKVNRNRRGRNRRWMRTKLLEMLLHDQIRKERNTLLQACRYITENNFFDGK